MQNFEIHVKQVEKDGIRYTNYSIIFIDSLGYRTLLTPYTKDPKQKNVRTKMVVNAMLASGIAMLVYDDPNTGKEK